MAGTVPGGQRAAKWNLKYDPARIQEITTAGKPTYSIHAAVVFDSLYEMELSVKQVLNSSGVSVLQIPGYLAFGREMWSKSQKMAGETLAQEAAVLIAKGVARGLIQAVMQAIRTDVFNVSAPIAP
jgi:hypothetical protein